MDLFGAVVRFVLSALVLLVVSLLVPGFHVGGFTGALVAALVIALLGRALEALFGRNASPQGRGLVSFILAAVVVYLTQFFVPTMRVTLLGALLAAFAIGVIDAFIPTVLR